MTKSTRTMTIKSVLMNSSSMQRFTIKVNQKKKKLGAKIKKKNCQNFKKHQKINGKELLELFKKLDVGGKGYIDAKDFRVNSKALGFENLSVEAIDKIIERMDVDKNHKLDFDEFKEFLLFAK